MKNGITNLTRTEVINLRDEINSTLSSLEEKYGIKISAGNASFSSNECTFKLKINTINEGGTVLTQEATNWDLYKNRTNCSHLKVGDKITIQGESYILTGYNTRARKAPIQFKDVIGHTNYKCSIQMLNLENSK